MSAHLPCGCYMTCLGHKPIGRAEFLHYRMAYLAKLREEGQDAISCLGACNLDDATQVHLLLMTWDERAAKAKR